MKVGILFDLDGTLLDSLADLHRCVNDTLRKYGCPERTYDEIRRFVGNGARRLIELALPGKENDPPVDVVLADYQQYYNQQCNQGTTCAYPGIDDALAVIREKYPVAVVSNKPDGAVKKLCKAFFGDAYALGVTPDCPRKPAPDMVYRAMEDLGVDKCIYVGDSEVDVATAKNANVPCLTVLWGFRDADVLREAGATYFCAKAEDMPAKIEEMIQKEL